jgi:hypothetical protein
MRAPQREITKDQPVTIQIILSTSSPSTNQLLFHATPNCSDRCPIRFGKVLRPEIQNPAAASPHEAGSKHLLRDYLGPVEKDYSEPRIATVDDGVRRIDFLK